MVIFPLAPDRTFWGNRWIPSVAGLTEGRRHSVQHSSLLPVQLVRYRDWRSLILKLLAALRRPHRRPHPPPVLLQLLCVPPSELLSSPPTKGTWYESLADPPGCSASSWRCGLYLSSSTFLPAHHTVSSYNSHWKLWFSHWHWVTVSFIVV